MLVCPAGQAALASTLRGLGRRVVTYGEAADADVRISDLAFVGTSSSATVTTEGWQGELRLGVPGRHNLANATAQIGTGLQLSNGVWGPVQANAQVSGNAGVTVHVDGIPAPASAALLGLGGLVAARRRRTA